MEWTRRPLMRALALGASVALVAVHWEDRGAWFWVGVALTLLNLGVLTVRAISPGDRPRDLSSERASREGRSHTLDELRSLPGVAAALAGGPPVWQQVSYLDDPLGPMPVEELAGYIWIEDHDGWGIGLGDEVKPYLDLDLDEADDPIIGVLRAHPARALVAHHVYALRGS